jgi:hypothetical protein
MIYHYRPPGSAPPVEEEPEPVDRESVSRPGWLPPRIQAAMAFVNNCNHYTHPLIAYDGEFSAAQIIHPELPPHQEAALRSACYALGDYFLEGLEIEACEHPEE